MSPKCQTCPIEGECKSYLFLCEKMVIAPIIYRAIFDQVNDIQPAANSLTTRHSPRTTSEPDPWLPLIRACPDHNPACCSNPAPWCTRFSISPTRDQCISCLEGQGMRSVS